MFLTVSVRKLPKLHLTWLVVVYHPLPDHVGAQLGDGVKTEENKRKGVYCRHGQ